MADCTALCKQSKGCRGFVFDQIPAESGGQCKVARLPAGEGCCLMKTMCIPGGRAKPGDTAVSFWGAAPATSTAP